MNKSASFIVGRVAALLVGVETIVFALSLIWELIVPTEFATNLGYVASLLIAVSVVIMMACFSDVTRARYKIFGTLALVASVIYAPFCMGIYFLQLSIVSSNPLGLTSQVLEAIAFKPGSPAFALDMLGYTFLCLSTLAAGFALVDAKDKALRTLCFVHGALVVPTIVSPLMSSLFLSTSGETDATGPFVLLLWCIIFVPIAMLFKRFFSRGQRLEASLDQTL